MYRVLVQTCTVHYLFVSWWESISLHALTCTTLSTLTLHVYSIASQLLKWSSPPWPWQAGQPPLRVSPGQPATPSATPSLCPTPPKVAPSMSPNLPTVTPLTLWPLSNLAPLTGLRWRLWGRETEQTDRGQRLWGTSLLINGNMWIPNYVYPVECDYCRKPIRIKYAVSLFNDLSVSPVHTALCPQSTVTVTVLSALLSLVLMLSLSTCAVSAVVHAVMYKRLQRCRAELRGGELCSTPQLSQSPLWSRTSASLHAGRGDSVKARPEGEGPPTSEEEEEEEGEKMQANPAYLPIEMTYKSQERKYINVPSWSNWRSVYSDMYSVWTNYRELGGSSELVYIHIRMYSAYAYVL